MAARTLGTQEISPTQTRLMYSADLAGLAARKRPVGHAYRRTLDLLGIAVKVSPDESGSGGTMTLHGNTETVRANLPQLVAKASLVAHQSGALSPHKFQAASYENLIQDALGKVGRISALPDEAPFGAVCTAVTEPLAKILALGVGLQIVPENN